MTFFTDLTTHTYTQGSEEHGVLNVGWLGELNPIRTGRTSAEFRDQFRELCSKPILLHRCVHLCEFCSGPSRASGNGQIPIRDRAGVWYSAPLLILHYVTKHDNLPPTQFVNAVLDPLDVATEDDCPM